jgi:LacI family transcriptional regulator
MATIRDVSRLAKVSVSTVSRVLNGVVPVTDAKRLAVLDAIDRLGYRPNVFARSLATNRSGGIGVVVNELSSPMYAAIIQGIENVIEGQGLHMIVSSGHATRPWNGPPTSS